MVRKVARPSGGRVVVKTRLICGSLLQRKYCLRDRVQSDVRINETCIRRSEPMLTRRAALFSAATAALMLATPSIAAEDLKLPRQKVELVAPPFVHAHEQATKQGPKIMEFKLVVAEKKVVIDEQGTTFQAMTFNGSMPGPLMVVHEGDYVELTLVNPDTNSMPHNIDFHAATGALGGGALTLINPGEQVVLRWKATRTGTFVYHCAPAGMIPWHVVSGMHGTVMVLPRDGLKNRESKPLRYDRIYYVGEN